MQEPKDAAARDDDLARAIRASGLSCLQIARRAGVHHKTASRAAKGGGLRMATYLRLRDAVRQIVKERAAAAAAAAEVLETEAAE